MEELKKCPFCGGEAKLGIIEYRYENTVECSQCNCLLDNIYTSKEQAIQAWNKRTNQ